MKETATHQSTYALGHSEQELERLSRQAQAFEPFTRQLLQQAGINTGMRVLDVGCGSGDVAIATAREVDVSSLAERLRDEVVAAKGVVLSPGLIGSWSRKLL